MNPRQRILERRRQQARPTLLAGAALLFFLVLPERGWSLDPAKDPQQYSCETWSRQDGLPTNGVNAITQSKDGYIWLGTQSGMVRFDGVQFAVVNLPEGPQFRREVISSLASSRDGGLWFGIASGSLGFYDGQGGFSSPGEAKWVDPRMNVTALCESTDGSLWVGTDKGVARYVKGKPALTIFDDRLPGVGAISEDSQGRIWLPTAAKGLYYWQAGNMIPFPDDSLKQEIIIAAAEDRQGGFWVGSSVGLRCYDANFRRLEIPPFAKAVRTILVDRQGVVWIGTVNDGLACYKNGAFSFFRQSDGLAHNLVTSLFEDREGSLWIGTRGGLNQFTDVKFPIYSAAEGLLGGSCHGVSASAQGGLWIATTQGLSHFDGKKGANYTTEQGLSDPYIKRAFEARDGDVYLLNGKMAIEILSQGKVVATFANKNWPTALAEDNEGVVVAVADQLFRVNRAGLVPYGFKNGQAPRMTWIRNLLVTRDGTLWVAAVNGIFRVKDGIVQRWSVADGLSDNDVYGLCEDNDNVLWAGLKTGVARITGGQIRNISRKDGLLDDSIFAIVPDDQGCFWMNSSRGIFQVKRQELNDFCDGKIPRIESAAYNGTNVVKTIDSVDVEYVGCKTPDGRIWFPSPLGAVAIDPTHIPVNRTSPLVRIESIRANGENLTGHRRQVVPPGSGELEFHFTALSFLAPQEVKFRYRLEGFEKDWVETENRRLAFYTNLKPGQYTFRVIAANADGAWNNTGDAIDVELRPHYFQTLWFRVLCGALGLGALTGIYLRRIRLLQDRERALQENRILLETEVRNRTAELLSENAERRRSEAKLSEASALLDVMLDNSPDLIYFKDRSSRFVRFSTACLHNVGLTDPGMMRGKTDADFSTSDHAEGAYADEQEIIRSGQPIIGKLERDTHSDGRVTWALSTKMPWRDGAGAIVGTLGISRDITSLKEAESKLAHERDQLRALLDSIPDTIYFKDLQLRFVLVSRSKVQNTIAHVPDLRARRAAAGLPADVPEAEMLTGLTDFDTYQDHDARAAFEDEQKIVRTGEAVIGKLEKQAFHDGTMRWTLTSKMPWRDREGKTIGTFGISKDITDLKEAENKVDQMHRELLTASRQAGMAEVATGVLHNVGNVLNSVNVSATLVSDQVRRSKAVNLAKVCALFDQHKEDLPSFLATDPKGKTIPVYLATLTENLATERQSVITELESLRKNIEHIKEIVAMQQDYAKTSGVNETVSIPDLVEDALRINAGSLARHDVDIAREYIARPVATLDKHKVIQILINLIRNAKYACGESGRPDKLITVRTTATDEWVRIAVIDNGVGIPPENLIRIFNHGFTTRKTGHGFGLHSGALAARELGGALDVKSDGPGHGASFTLELPLKPKFAAPAKS